MLPWELVVFRSVRNRFQTPRRSGQWWMIPNQLSCAPIEAVSSVRAVATATNCLEETFQATWPNMVHDGPRPHSTRFFFIRPQASRLKPTNYTILYIRFYHSCNIDRFEDVFPGCSEQPQLFLHQHQRWETKSSRICGRTWRLWTNWLELMPFPGRCPFATQNLGSHMLKPPKSFRNFLCQFPRVQL